MNINEEIIEESLKEDLKILCIHFIDLFEDLRNKGKISEEEYHSHTYLKKRFIENS